MGNPWSTPSVTQGFRTGEYVGALVLMTVTGYVPEINTTYGVKDAVRVNLTVCYHPMDNTKNGEGQAHTLIFNTPIVSSLRSEVGKTVGGRLSQEQGQGGNTKMVLREVEDDASVQWLQHYWPQHCQIFQVDPATGQAKPDSPQGQQQSQSPPPPPAPNGQPSSPASEPSGPPPPPSGNAPSTPGAPPPPPQGQPPFSGDEPPF